MSFCDDASLRVRALRAARLAVPTLLLLALAACGFRPLYSTRTYNVAPELAAIKVSSIADRRGQELRNLLYAELNPKGVPAQPIYVLDTDLSVSKQNLAIAKDETVTRANLIIVARYVMRTIETGQILFKSESSATTSFDVVRSEYANIAAEKDAQSRGLKVVSDDMTLRLSFYFTRQDKSAAQAKPVQVPAPSVSPANIPTTAPQGYVPPAYAPLGYAPPTYAPAPQGYVPPAYVPPASVPSAYAPPAAGPPAYDPPATAPPANR
jgi:LPS-assembly lipoprotein